MSRCDMQEQSSRADAYLATRCYFNSFAEWLSEAALLVTSNRSFNEQHRVRLDLPEDRDSVRENFI